MWPTRLLRPWDFPGKSAGVGCHRLLWLKRTNFNQLLLVEAVIKMKPGPSVGDKDSDPLEKKHQWHLVRTWGMDIYNINVCIRYIDAAFFGKQSLHPRSKPCRMLWSQPDSRKEHSRQRGQRSWYDNKPSGFKELEECWHGSSGLS